MGRHLETQYDALYAKALSEAGDCFQLRWSDLERKEQIIHKRALKIKKYLERNPNLFEVKVSIKFKDPENETKLHAKLGALDIDITKPLGKLINNGQELKRN